MYHVIDMINDMKESYDIFLNENRGINYAFIRLWEEYNDNTGDEELFVFNIIIAKMNLEHDEISNNHKRFVKETMEKYENMSKKIEAYYGKEDLQLINELLNEINAKCYLWK